MSAVTAIETRAVERAAAVVTTAPHAAQEWLTFRLGAEEYGMDILRVQEIRSYEQPTRIANMPAAVKGVMDLRGVIVPIVDLRMHFGMDEPRYDGSTVTVVINVGGRVVGVVVDAVSEVIELRPDDVKPFPDMAARVESRCVTGVGSVEHDGRTRLLILLDIAAVVAGTAVGAATAAG